MSRTINKVELLGRVGTDPEMRYTPNGTAVTNLRLATDRRRQNGETDTDWHDVIVWAKTAEFAYEKASFLLLARSEEEAPTLHHRFLDKRSPLPLHRSWAEWLWHRGLEEGEIVPLQSVGVTAYRCRPTPTSCGKISPGRWTRAGSPCRGEDSDG